MISIMIMSHNNHELLEQCLANIAEYTPISHEIVVVDDASDPKYNEQGITIVRMPRRSNCCNLRNVGMEMCKTDIVCWLDNDTFVGPGWYEGLLKTMEDKTVGMVGTPSQAMMVRKPFLPLTQAECMQEAQFLKGFKESGDCDYIVSYFLAMRKEAYRPTYCYGMPTPVLDPDNGAGIKMNGYRVVVTQEPCQYQHLGSQTPREGGNGYQQTLAVNFTRWWKTWEPHAHKVFELYK